MKSSPPSVPAEWARSIAIKVLPAAMASDADRLARFQREAELLAALNHPNVGAIYGLEKTHFTALVMELVEGEDLSQRIAKGAIPIDEALPIATQIYTESVAGTQTVPSQQRYRVMAAPMVDPRRPGKPRQLFENVNEVLPLNQCASTACYSVSPDGQSFYTLQFRARARPRVKSLRLVLNWFDDVRRLAPAN